MKNKHIICVDLDDTLAESATTIISFAQKCDIEMFGGTGKMSKIDNCVDHFYFAKMLGWSTEQLIIFFDNYYLEYLKVIKPKENASYFVDDSLDQCLSVKCKSPSTKVYLMETGFNAALTDYKIEKVPNLLALYYRVEEDIKGNN